MLAYKRVVSTAVSIKSCFYKAMVRLKMAITLNLIKHKKWSNTRSFESIFHSVENTWGIQ